MKALICVGLWLRVLGAAAKYKVYLEFYGGFADSGVYYRMGLQYAEAFRQLDFSSLFDASGWHGGSWVGTQSIYFLSGGVMTFLGTSMVAEYIVFSLFAFVGIMGFAIAFRSAYPGVPWTRYLRWILLFPSIWFWTATVGKEAVLMMGLGIAVRGFIGRRGRVNWALLVIGTFFVYAVRVQVAGILLGSMVAAQWLSRGGRWTVGRIVQGAVLLVVGLAGVSLSMQSVGIEEFGVEGVQEYVETDPSRTTAGGTNVDAVSPSLTGIPMAAFNILFRPLPWEATNVMVLLASLEIFAFWAIALGRGKNLLRALRHWRSDRFLALAIIFTLVYAVGLGMMVINLGIIARQRVLVFPFLFILLEAWPKPMARRRRRPQHVGRRVPARRRSPTYAHGNARQAAPSTLGWRGTG
ncbi:MAG: hypothetical protein ACREMD_16200 [Gemmatimonadota bacterium]